MVKGSIGFRPVVRQHTKVGVHGREGCSLHGCWEREGGGGRDIEKKYPGSLYSLQGHTPIIKLLFPRLYNLNTVTMVTKSATGVLWKTLKIQIRVIINKKIKQL